MLLSCSSSKLACIHTLSKVENSDMLSRLGSSFQRSVLACVSSFIARTFNIQITNNIAVILIFLFTERDGVSAVHSPNPVAVTPFSSWICIWSVLVFNLSGIFGGFHFHWYSILGSLHFNQCQCIRSSFIPRACEKGDKKIHRGRQARRSSSRFRIQT